MRALPQAGSQRFGDGALIPFFRARTPLFDLRLARIRTCLDFKVRASDFGELRLETEYAIT